MAMVRWDIVVICVQTVIDAYQKCQRKRHNYSGKKKERRESTFEFRSRQEARHRQLSVGVQQAVTSKGQGEVAGNVCLFEKLSL